MSQEVWPAHCTCEKIIPHIAGLCPEHGGMWSYKCGACQDHLKRNEASQAANLMRKMEWFEAMSRILSKKAGESRLKINEMRANPNHGIHNLMPLSFFGMKKEDAERIAAVKNCTCEAPLYWTAGRLINCPEHQGPWDPGCAACWFHLYDHELSRAMQKPNAGQISLETIER
jgi:hypothetical protein